jgi:hypothetical protein
VLQTEALRGARQYGALVPISELPCSALGARADLEAVGGDDDGDDDDDLDDDENDDVDAPHDGDAGDDDDTNN